MKEGGWVMEGVFCGRQAKEAEAQQQLATGRRIILPPVCVCFCGYLCGDEGIMKKMKRGFVCVCLCV